MIKDTPSIGRMAAMIGFAFSCVAILLYLWLQFGGTVPLRPEGYRFEASFKEAALLVKEADVRIAGLDVGQGQGQAPRCQERGHDRHDRDRRAVRAAAARDAGAAAHQGAAR